MYKYVNLNDTVYLHFPVNNTEGSGASGVTPAVQIRRSGDVANAAPVYSATPYLLSHVSFPQGCYEVSIPATTGNGFIIGNEYNAFATISISSQNPTGYIGGFTLNPVNISQNIVKSGVIDALNTVVLSTAPSGSINEKMYNLATNDELATDILNASVASYNTLQTVGKILKDLSSGSISLTAQQIREEIDANSTQLAALTSRLSSARASYLDNLSSGIVATYSQVDTVNNLVNAINSITSQLNFTGTKVNAFTNDSSGVVTLLNRVIGTIAAGTHQPQTGDAYAIVTNAEYGNDAIQNDVASQSSYLNSIYNVANKLDTTLELNGAVYRFTELALANSPTGSGGFTETDRTNLLSTTTVTSILNTMIENVGGNRYKAKALETAPISTLATSSGLITVSNKIDAVATNVDSILLDTGTDGVKVQDVETGLSFVHAMQGLFALVCKMNGGGTTTINARDFADTKNRVTWNTDLQNNRLSVTFSFD